MNDTDVAGGISFGDDTYADFYYGNNITLDSLYGVVNADSSPFIDDTSEYDPVPCPCSNCNKSNTNINITENKPKYQGGSNPYQLPFGLMPSQYFRSQFLPKKGGCSGCSCSCSSIFGKCYCLYIWLFIIFIVTIILLKQAFSQKTIVVIPSQSIPIIPQSSTT